MEHIIKWTI